MTRTGHHGETASPRAESAGRRKFGGWNRRLFAILSHAKFALARRLNKEIGSCRDRLRDCSVNMLRCLAFCLLVFCWPTSAWSQAQLSDGPSDQVEQPGTETKFKLGDREIAIVDERRLATFFLGRLEPEEKGVFRCRIENPFDVTLSCLTLERSCQCSSAKIVTSKPFAPKESLEIELTVDGRGKAGQSGAELYFQLVETGSLESEQGTLKVYRLIQPFQFWVSGEGGFHGGFVEIELDPEVDRPLEFAAFNFSTRPWSTVVAEVAVPGLDDKWHLEGVLSEHNANGIPSQTVEFRVPDSLKTRMLESEVQGSVELFASAGDGQVLKKITTARFSGKRVEVLRIVPPVLIVDASSASTTFHVISPTNTIKVKEAEIAVSVDANGGETLPDLKIVPKQESWVTVTVSSESLSSVADKPLAVVLSFNDGTNYRLPLKLVK